MAKVFFSYSHDDEAFRDRLEKHLALLQRQGLIESWHDRRILAGSVIDDAISEQLEAAEIILLLVSASFIASNYCYSKEMALALERHNEGAATVVPVIVSPCDWHSAPFGSLLAAPKDGKAVALWTNHDEAYADIARQVRAIVEAKSLPKAARTWQTTLSAPAVSAANARELPRSSNLRLKKEYTDRDTDAFLHEGFEYIARFFAGSLEELTARNVGIEAVFRRIDANTFTGTIYNTGRKVSECSIRLGGMASESAITYSASTSSSTGFNEMLSVRVDDQSIFFDAMGASFRAEAKNLSPEGAAEYLWSMLIERLQ
jgi:hypothetical protein